VKSPVAIFSAPDLLSTTSVVSSSVIARANTLLFASSGTAGAEALAGVPPREQLLLDFGWKFILGHASDPLRDLGFGKGPDDFSKTDNFEFATAKFDDSGWRSLNLPHDWAIELPFVRAESLQSHGYKPLGRKYPENSVGWYRRAFEIPATDAGRRIVLEFDGAFRNRSITSPFGKMCRFARAATASLPPVTTDPPLTPSNGR
jgi:beta-galactosidase